jgi:F0F1-type ATP synthase delta subunit
MDQFGVAKTDKFMKLLRDNDIHPESNSSLQEWLKILLAKISSLPIVSLTLAFEPDESTTKIISGWFPLNINNQALLNITVQPDLIDGAVVDFNGKHGDFSLKPTFDRILEQVLKDKN